MKYVSVSLKDGPEIWYEMIEGVRELFPIPYDVWISPTNYYIQIKIISRTFVKVCEKQSDEKNFLKQVIPRIKANIEKRQNFFDNVNEYFNKLDRDIPPSLSDDDKEIKEKEKEQEDVIIEDKEKKKHKDKVKEKKDEKDKEEKNKDQHKGKLQAKKKKSDKEENEEKEMEKEPKKVKNKKPATDEDDENYQDDHMNDIEPPASESS